jgi:hypothetical protein
LEELSRQVLQEKERANLAHLRADGEHERADAEASRAEAERLRALDALRELDELRSRRERGWT